MADGPSELKSRDILEGKKKKKKKSGKNDTSWLTRGFQSVYKGLFDTQGQAGSLAETIEKQAAAQKRAAIKERAKSGVGPEASPFQALQDQLFGSVNDINVAPTPFEELSQMANKQAGMQFDPLIAALGEEIRGKQKRGARSQRTARDMYGSLSQDFLSQLPEMTQQFAAEDAATNQRYDQAQSQMDGEYQKQAAQQEAVLKRLGVQAAQQESSQQARDDQAYFQNQMEMDQQQAMNALNEQQMADTQYQRSLGNNAKMAGENTAQDIGMMLEDYMDQAQGQMTGLRGQKSAAISALLQQLQAQDQERVQTQSQQEFDNMMKLFNYQLDATKAMGEQQGSENEASSLFKGTTGLAGASNYIAEQYPDQPILSKNLMEQINDVLANKNVVRGKYVLEPGDESLGRSPKYSDVGQEYLMDLLRAEFEKEGDRYTPGNINVALNGMLAYLGKLR